MIEQNTTTMHARAPHPTICVDGRHVEIDTELREITLAQCVTDDGCAVNATTKKVRRNKTCAKEARDNFATMWTEKTSRADVFTLVCLDLDDR